MKVCWPCNWRTSPALGGEKLEACRKRWSKTANPASQSIGEECRAMLRSELILFLLMTAAARADAPLPPPEDGEVRCPNSRCVVRAEVAAAQVRIGGRAPNGKVVSWSIPGWHRVLLVGNDCRVVGVGYHGINLLDLQDREPGTVVMTFFRSDGPARVVRLRDLYPDLAVLPRTASHWS